MHFPSYLLLRRALLATALVVAGCTATDPLAQAPAVSAREARVAQRLEAARNSPPALRAMLTAFPKGGDLHMHLSGAVYAETFIHEAAAENLCADPVKLLLLPNIGTTKSIPPRPVCAEGTVPAANALTNQKLYDALIDSFSMRTFVPTSGTSGHDQFFATFPRFSGLSKHNLPEWLDEVATRAAAQNEQYLEIMHTPDVVPVARLAAGATLDPANPEPFYQYLLAHGIRDLAKQATDEMQSAMQARREREHCDTAQAQPACQVQIRMLYQVLRALPLPTVFAQSVMAYEMGTAAANDPNYVGLNYVQPEDTLASMSQYSAEMHLLQFLQSKYKTQPRHARLSLHAGELTLGLVPPDGLRFHIREAIEIAGAERIGHGDDVAYETDAPALLREMAAKHVSVEINLSSNDGILGIRGADHPLAIYRAAGVPFHLSTDDEGVSRIDLTNEYVRAVTDQHLTYSALKQSARASLEHSFLHGDSLWSAPDRFTATRSGCPLPARSTDVPGSTCQTLFHSSDKALQQWELERRFIAFEESTLAQPAAYNGLASTSRAQGSQSGRNPSEAF
ncbi:amidohydrolase family protein [Terriglobus aquaticus]|uniref:adenosine deaminase n=1 Tax=Terriglobus aquaticus TaxID=940139 RepID=A0ABW9KFQ1_9BACT|nr:adenosine deaminase [Terriglobus aquaticus]